VANKSGTSSGAVPLPKGGGAIQGIGEQFAPDPFTGGGKFSVPIGLPSGRGGLQPRLSLDYATSNGAGPFGLGWALSLPGVSRKTNKGIPRYRDESADPHERDVFLLSGAEDLVAVEALPDGVTRYRPRTEGLFARIDHVRGTGRDEWRVTSRDGLVSRYGLPDPVTADPAVLADPASPGHIFAWKLIETVDPHGNRIEYRYRRDRQANGSRQWDQLYLDEIAYADFEEGGETKFLVTVRFLYEERPDPFSDCRAGFELRTRERCTRIEVRTHAGQDRLQRSYEFEYLDARVAAGELPAGELPPNGLSLLSRVRIVGHDGDRTEALAPLEFGYTKFTPQQQNFQPLEASDGAMPPVSLANEDFEMVSLFGNGLPDLIQLNGVARFWRNLGGGQYDAAAPISEIPSGIHLRDPGVQLADMNGDGRADLLVLERNGYFPQKFLGRWSADGFVEYEHSPAVNFADAELRLLDVDGDGVVDALRTGIDLELFINDPDRGWEPPALIQRSTIDDFPNLNFSDPHVKLADMNGDNLQDLVFVQQGRIDYWPYLGHGRWGGRGTMTGSPTFQDAVPLPNGGFDPRRVLFGDLDGDGLDDLVYVEPGRMTFWINQGGNGWSAPIVIDGTPDFPEADAVRLADVYGTGFQGILWTADQLGPSSAYQFLELTGRVKPYVMETIDNHRGALTRTEYTSSTEFYRADFADAATRWKSPLPVPVQVVKRIESIDLISGSKLTSEFRYHHGYWDGNERELRGFGLVDQFDSESFDRFHGGAHPESGAVTPLDSSRFSPPALTRRWFHLGDVGDDPQERTEIDYSTEYWAGDPSLQPRPAATVSLLQQLPASARGSALRSLRGSMLRSELYALDGSARASRPYTVIETQYGIREEETPAAASTRPRIFFPHSVIQRTTEWERGEDPLTRFVCLDDYDAYGQPRRQVNVAVPRGRKYQASASPGDPYIVTLIETAFAQRDTADRFIVDRVASTTEFEIGNDGSAAVSTLVRQSLDGSAPRRLLNQTFNYYDGAAFEGLAHRAIGAFGALVRSESLVITEEILQAAYEDAGTAASGIPRYLRPGATVAWPDEYPQGFRQSLPPLAGYVFADGTDHRARGYFAPGVRAEFDFHRQDMPARGLAVKTRDAFGRDITIALDRPYHLFPVQTTDAAGLTTTVQFDYRVLQPSMTTDPNGNRRAVRFTPLGLVGASLVMGRDGEPVGDTADAPSTRFEYDFLAFHRTRHDPDPQPVWVRRTAREHYVNDTDVPMPARNAAIETVEYSDGFGRPLQTRSGGEDVGFGDAVFGGGVLSGDQSNASRDVFGTRAPAGAPPVIVSGWKVYDNKGRVIQQYEPFAATGWKYDPPGDAQMGQKVETFYDPLGRIVRALNPDGSEQRIVHGAVPDLQIEHMAPTPWETYTYDANDLAAGSAVPHAGVPAAHHLTPSSTIVDALGRVIESVMRTRELPQNPGDPPGPIVAVRTRMTYDSRGNILTVRDALDRVAWRYVYDLSNRPWRLENIDGGRRRVVLDAAGREIERRDSKGAVILHAYDGLGRPARVWSRDAAAAAILLQQRMEYGDGGAPDQPSAARAAMRARNLLGQLHRHHDGAGLTTFDAVDIAGNIVDKSRRVVADAPLLAAFAQAPANGWTIPPVAIDWQPRPQQTLQDREAELLEASGYRTQTVFDAVGRVRLLQLPEDVEEKRRTLRPSYNNAGALERVLLDDVVYVDRIAYDAKGQRVFIALGNGVMTRYAYDARTFRLIRLRSERYTKTDDVSYRGSGEPLQDTGYDYDPVGNLVALRERTAASGIPNNPEAASAADPVLAQLLSSGNALTRTFTYDPLYRLRSANGRECDVPPTHEPWRDEPRCTDLTKARAYTEKYRYDLAGNLLRLEHANSTGGFTREFEVDGATNRLKRVKTGSDSVDVEADANGSVLSKTASRRFEWNHADQLRTFRVQAGAGEPSIYAWYLYDAMNRRVKKLVRTQGGAFTAVHYIDDVYEHSRSGGAAPVARNRVHVMDDRRRIAVVRIGTAEAGDSGPAVQFHLGDHLGSSAVVVDGQGAAVNAEEYTPFGETSFGSFAKKRYRYAGAEKDAESGLSYQGARYYSPWTARWTAADPLGLAFDPERPGHATSSFLYGLNNPLRFIDPDGEDEDESFRKTKPKIKVIGGALVDEKVRDGSGNEAGHVKIGEGNIKINPADAAVEGNLSVLDVEAAPKVTEDVSIIAGAKVAKAKVAVGKSGVEAEAVAFEAGVGAKAGPVKGKVLFGLGAKVKMRDGKLGLKLMAGIGGEIEIDFGSIVRFFNGSVEARPVNIEMTSSPEETSIRTSSVAHEVAPPLPKKVPRPRRCVRKARVKYSEAFEYLGYPASNAG
jgi:RHS repeat-associated protein